MVFQTGASAGLGFISWVALAAAALADRGAARACDFCYKDQAAASYSYANREIARRIDGASVSIRINGIHSEEELLRFKKVLSSVSGIVSGTLRISPKNLTASFVLEKKASFGEIAREISRRFGQGVGIERIPEIGRSS